MNFSPFVRTTEKSQNSLSIGKAAAQSHF